MQVTKKELKQFTHADGTTVPMWHYHVHYMVRSVPSAHAPAMCNALPPVGAWRSFVCMRTLCPCTSVTAWCWGESSPALYHACHVIVLPSPELQGSCII